MNQLKRYLFWWICGALLVVELILILLLSPTDQNGKEPEQVKAELDKQVKSLQELEKRSDRTPGVFDAEKKADIDDLTKNYLITKEWGPRLQKTVDRYQAQIDGIGADLAERSRPLRDPLTPTQDLYEWKNRYLDDSERLLQRLADAGQLVIPERSAAGAAGGKSESSADERPFHDNALMRKVGGFETPHGVTFTADQHPVLTARMRIAAQLIESLLKTVATTPPNPAVNRGRDALPEQKPRLVGIEWSQRDEAFKGELAAHVAKSYQATVRLQGAESALVAAISAIEQIERPILVVTGATIDRIPYGPGKRLGDDALIIPEQATIELIALDMTPPPAVATKEGK